MPTQEQPAALDALNELAPQAHTPEDVAQLAEWEDEISNERNEAIRKLSKPAANFIVGGVVVSADEIKNARDAGHDTTVSGYKNGQR